jgi:hypothetical protein
MVLLAMAKGYSGATNSLSQRPFTSSCGRLSNELQSDHVTSALGNLAEWA